ncbi:MAG: ROK family protein [Anaerolineales bacterium]|nr:ROK family protein [Anaerolineales bacterium]
MTVADARVKRPVTIGLDIGGTKTAVLVADGAQRVLAQARGATQADTPAALLAATRRLVCDALAAAGLTAAQVAAIGVGVPGQVNADSGEVLLAVNLNLTNYPLGSALAEACGAPCLVENDARLAAVGAYAWLAARQPVRHVAYLSVGTGISAGFVLDGALYRGAHGLAGEIGHVVVEPDGARCGCGARGCLETIVSGPAIARQGAAVLPPPCTAADVYAAARQGHPGAQAVVQRVSGYLARAIQWLLMTTDVEKIVIGGGVAGAGAAFLDPILHELARLRGHSPLFQTMLRDDKLVLLPPDYNAGTWGAVRLAQQAIPL